MSNEMLGVGGKMALLIVKVADPWHSDLSCDLEKLHYKKNVSFVSVRIIRALKSCWVKKREKSLSLQIAGNSR